VSPPAPPPPNPCADIRGSGTLRTNPQARFSLSVRYKSRTKTFSGSITYTDSAAGLSFESTGITGIDNRGGTATITGSGRANGTAVTFVITVGDQAPGFFSIKLSNGYAAESALKQGRIQIRDQC
jgi:hypothetical protein